MQTYKLKNGNFLRIEQEEQPQDPRTWDNLGRMVCFHNRYELGDETQLEKDDFDSWDDLRTVLTNEYEAVIVLPLILLDHSGLSMSTSRNYPFNCNWDAGQVGWIYTTNEAIKETYDVTEVTPELLKEVTDSLIDEVKTYSQYLEGDIWGLAEYKLETCNMGCEHEITINSCWGFYGSDPKKNGMLEHLTSEIED
jgi:hypothetical protein